MTNKEREVHNRTREKGFSLVELMVGLVVGLFVSGIVITIFVQTKRHYTQDELISNMQENGRYALQLLSREISHAGFLGGMSAVDTVNSTVTADLGDCADYMADPLANPIEIYNATNANGRDCFDSETVKGGTQVVVIKRTKGKQTTSLTANRLYFATAGQGGTIFNYTDANSATPYAAQQKWEYNVEIYYIKDEDSDGDGVDVPGLFRKRLVGTNIVNDGLLVPGVRAIGVLYGLDSTGNGIADNFTVASSYTGDKSKIVSARVSVLAMSTEDDAAKEGPDSSVDADQANDKTYTLYPGSVAAARFGGLSGSDYYGRMFSTTTQVRNNAYRIQIFNLSK